MKIFPNKSVIDLFFEDNDWVSTHFADREKTPFEDIHYQYKDTIEGQMLFVDGVIFNEYSREEYLSEKMIAVENIILHPSHYDKMMTVTKLKYK